MGVKSKMKSIDITSQKLVAMRDAQNAVAAGANKVLIAENCVVTPSARDFLAQHNIALVANGKGSAASQPVQKTGAAPAASAYGNSSAAKPRSEEHTSELQSRQYLVCRLL